MLAAVVTSFGSAPRAAEFRTPVPQGEREMLVDVLAVGLHPRVRSQAAGSHYTSTDRLPLVPGVDGVGRGPDGALRYFVLADTTLGSMAEQTVIDVRRSVVLPDGVDPVVVAAAMNPAMSSWIALRHRTSFAAGQKVLVLGATGNAGRMAVRIATFFGAGAVTGVARDAEALAALAGLGATNTVVLDGSPAAAAQLSKAGADVDIVLDYLWGQPAADALAAIVPARIDDDQQLTLGPDRLGGRPDLARPVRRPARDPAADRRQRAGVSEPPTSWPSFPAWPSCSATTPSRSRSTPSR